MDTIYYYLIAIIIIIIIIVIAYFYFFKSSTSTAEVSETIEIPLTYTSGRYVRIKLEGENKELGLSEVEVMSNGVNVALNKPATDSSVYTTLPSLTPNRANDGRASGNLWQRSDVALTNRETNPWWEVDLGDIYKIDSIKITNRMESQYWAELNGLVIEVLDSNRNVVSTKTIEKPQFQSELVYN